MLLRKEVRLGLAIGGVLLAVVVVYVLVVTAGHDKPQGVSLDQTDASQAPSQQTPPPEPTTRESTPPLNSGAGSLASGQDAAPSNDPWTNILATGHVPVMYTATPSTTVTPAPPVPAAANQPTPAVGTGSGTMSSSSPPIVANSGDTITSGSFDRQPIPSSLGPTTRSTDSTPASSARSHLVKEGESFATIAQAVYGNASYYPHLIRANPTLDPRKLRPGMTINLPPVNEVRVESTPRPAAGQVAPTPIDARTEYRVADGDSLEKISMKLYGRRDRFERIYELNKATIGPDPARLKIGMVLKLPEPPTTAR